MRPPFLTLMAALFTIFATPGCGGAGKPTTTTAPAPEPEPAMDAEDLIPRAVLVSAELTTEVDEKRFRATGDIASSFEPDEPVIYLVATLKSVPTQARIEVRWQRDADPSPILVSSINGSDRFSFVADLRPAEKAFIPGSYSARIFVDDREVGGPSFTILGDDPFANGPRLTRLKVSTSVNGKMKPKNPGRVFPVGTKTLHATFNVAGAVPGTEVAVRWTRNGAPFSEQTVEIAPMGRFGANIESPSGLPAGAYEVLVEVDGETMMKRAFTVGEETAGPSVDKVALGLALGADNLPEDELAVFEAGHPAILCGLRFLDVPPQSVITILWNQVLGDEESTCHTTKTAVPDGGSGTLGAAWEPTEPFEAGSYKVVVMVNEETVAEKSFTIE